MAFGRQDGATPLKLIDEIKETVQIDSRAIQDIRKKENLNPNDRISVTISTDDYLKKVFEKHSKLIQSTTLVGKIKYSAEKQTRAVEIDGHEISICLTTFIPPTELF